ncbi:MAG: LacI family DNA-binding transcriptional regulator [Brachybacterium sp.]|nr:LacI family DNA-binding transcriptional regulator [Brachybacterium sp.]
MVGLRDVAARAGVSLMTVSNVVNERRGRVSQETYESVQRAIRELDYVPNAQARSLSAGRTGLIGMVMRRPPETDANLRNPHDALLIGTIEQEISSAGLSFVFSAHDDVVSAAREMSMWRIDGMLVYGSVADEVDTLTRRAGKPIVFIDNYSPEESVEIVGVDDHAGGVLLGRHLADQGHASVLFAGPQHQGGGVVDRRLSGLQDGLAEAGGQGATVSVIDVGSGTAAAGEVVARVRAADGAFTAVVAHGDLLGVPLVPALVDAGFSVPGDVAVASFDDGEACTWVRPQLTSVRQDVEQKGRVAVRRLRELIESPAAGALRGPERLSVTLQVRASTVRTA